MRIIFRTDTGAEFADKREQCSFDDKICRCLAILYNFLYFAFTYLSEYRQSYVCRENMYNLSKHLRSWNEKQEAALACFTITSEIDEQSSQTVEFLMVKFPPPNVEKVGEVFQMLVTF